MNNENKLGNSGLEMEKGSSALEEAQILFDNAKYDGAVSRAYYAAFHYACAALLSKGLEAKSHQGMQRLFHLHFIRTKIFNNKAGVILSHAQKAREEADYYPEISFTKEIAEERLNEVKTFVKQLHAYLES
ncbi:MAG: HEPN domain-containing protein [Pseudomonadota bacterium]